MFLVLCCSPQFFALSVGRLFALLLCFPPWTAQLVSCS
jgi:hypothetical protein